MGFNNVSLPPGAIDLQSPGVKESYRPRWSFSRLQTFKQCQLKFMFKYLTKPHIAAPTTSPGAARGAALHAQVEEYMNGERSLESCDKALLRMGMYFRIVRGSDVVSEVGVYCDEDGEPVQDEASCFAMGFIDLFYVYKGEYVIADIKTGSVKKDGGIYADAIKKAAEQTAVYAGMLSPVIDVPVDQIYTRGIYVDACTELALETDYTLEKFLAECKAADKTVSEATSRALPARVNRFCKWCEFSKQNGGPCPYA